MMPQSGYGAQSYHGQFGDYHQPNLNPRSVAQRYSGGMTMAAPSSIPMFVDDDFPEDGIPDHPMDDKMPTNSGMQQQRLQQFHNFGYGDQHYNAYLNAFDQSNHRSMNKMEGQYTGESWPHVSNGMAQPMDTHMNPQRIRHMRQQSLHETYQRAPQMLPHKATQMYQHHVQQTFEQHSPQIPQQRAPQQMHQQRVPQAVQPKFSLGAPQQPPQRDPQGLLAPIPRTPNPAARVAKPKGAPQPSIRPPPPPLSPAPHPVKVVPAQVTQENSAPAAIDKYNQKVLHFLTVTINSIDDWRYWPTKSNIYTQMLFQVFGVLESVETDPFDNQAKKITLTDGGETFCCIFYEIDRHLPPIRIDEWQRCVGRFQQDESINVKNRIFQCLSIRSATYQEQLCRKFLAEFSRNKMVVCGVAEN